jgi:hypothetical protein
MQDAWQRRHAIQIVAQLPEKSEDALMVLELAKELVQGFLAGGGSGDQALRLASSSGSVIAFSASSSSVLSLKE